MDSLIVIGGRSGVGKTTAAHALHALLSQQGVRHAVIDGDYLDLACPALRGADLAMRNLSSIWENYKEFGYRRLVYTNTASVLEVPAIVTAMGGRARVTSVLLTASDAVVDSRLSLRETGSELIAHRERSKRMASLLDQDAPTTTHRILTDALAAVEIAKKINSLSEWAAEPPVEMLRPGP